MQYEGVHPLTGVLLYIFKLNGIYEIYYIDFRLIFIYIIVPSNAASMLAAV